MLATDHVKEKIAEAKAKEEDSIRLMNPSGGPKLVLPIPGPPPSKQPQKEKSFVAKTSFFKRIMVELDLSQRQTTKAGTIFKEETGGKVEPYMKQAIQDELHMLNTFFETVEMTFEVHPEDYESLDDDFEEEDQPRARAAGDLVLKKRHVVKVKNIGDLISYLVEHRNLDHNYHIKIGIDGGQGFLKVALILQEKVSETDIDDSTRSPLKKKPAMSREPKSGGTKKSLIIFLGEKIPGMSVLLNVFSVCPAPYGPILKLPIYLS